MQLCGNKVDRTIYELIGHGPTRLLFSYRKTFGGTADFKLPHHMRLSHRLFSNEPKLQRATCTVSQLRRTETQTRVLEASRKFCLCPHVRSNFVAQTSVQFFKSSSILAQVCVLAELWLSEESMEQHFSVFLHNTTLSSHGILLLNCCVVYQSTVKLAKTLSRHFY